MTTFVLATANPHKTREMLAIFAELHIEVAPRPRDIGEVAETSETLEGNALLKARAIVEATGLAAVADDTGLFVDALAGQPGVQSARYAGEGASDHDNVVKLLGALAGVHATQRTASFRTVIAAVYPNGEWFAVQGELEGTILQESRGDGGFGYDSVFVPLEGSGRTLAELSVEEKNATSHRARALRSFAEELSSR